MQAGQRNVHSPVLEGTYLRPVKPGLIGKLILREPFLDSERLDASTQPLLNLLPLHQSSFAVFCLNAYYLYVEITACGELTHSCKLERLVGRVRPLRRSDV